MAKRRGSIVRRAWAQKGHPCNDYHRKFGLRRNTVREVEAFEVLVNGLLMRSAPQETPLLSTIQKVRGLTPRVAEGWILDDQEEKSDGTEGD